MANQALHILILSSWYPTKDKPFLGNFVQRQAELLSTKYNVTVVHTVSDQSTNETVIDSSEEKSFKEIIVTHPRGEGFFAREKQQRLALYAGLSGLIEIDIIIGNVLVPKGHQFVMASKMLKCPLIYLEHGSFYRNSIRSKWPLKNKFLLSIIRRNVKAVVAVSSFLKKDMQSDFKRTKIQVIGNHVDKSFFQPNEKQKHEITQFLHVSTMDESVKNPLGILQACELLQKTHSSFKLTIICDEDATKWKAHSTSMGLDKHIEFIGPLPWGELPAHYQNSDAFILFSDYESFSIVIAEAWATGTPVLSTSVGIAANMPSTLGIQIENGNIQQLSEAMISIIVEKEKFNQSEITSHATQFNAEETLALWDKLIVENVR